MKDKDSTMIKTTDSEECEFCGDAKAKYTEQIWGIYFWCEDCEDDAAWTIYNNSLEEI
jgi:hypothetical protein